MEGKLKQFTSKQHSTGHLSQRSETPIIGKYHLNGGVSLTDTNNMKKNTWLLFVISHSLSNLLAPAKITA